jgi:hypothetical protein
MTKDNDKAANQGRFGSFSGVFTPNALTILGLILFLRTGWIVGQVGLAGALLIIVPANLISFVTGLSISAIATDMNVEAGGAYRMIARRPSISGASCSRCRPPCWFEVPRSRIFYKPRTARCKGLGKSNRNRVDFR